MNSKDQRKVPRDALEDLWRLGRGEAHSLSNIELSGVEPALPSSFCVGTAAQVSIAAAGLAAAEIHQLRGGQAQTVSVDMHHAATEFRSESCLRVDGEAVPLWDALAGTYQCGDGRWVRIHTNFAHHRQGILDLLKCEPERDAVAAAFLKWSAAEFEQRAAAHGAISAMMRPHTEWNEHPQGRAVAATPVISFEQIDDSPPVPLKLHQRPLGGVRVLDMTRIIAGPIAGRTLAAHGADVLLVTAAHLPSVAPLVIDTGRGKLSCHVDLEQPRGVERLEALLEDADVIVQGYRPGALAARGISPQRAAQLRPGIIYVSLSAYGHTGPWAARRGFDSIVQTASGFNADEADLAGVDEPKALPCQALDHASGYLMAFAAMMALKRRATQGGSWHVRASLAGTGRWIRDLGRVPDGLDCASVEDAAVVPLLRTDDSGFGRLTTVRHAALLSHTPADWARPSVPLGTHPARWPDA